MLVTPFVVPPSTPVQTGCYDLVANFGGELLDWNIFLGTQPEGASTCLTIPAGTFGGRDEGDRLADAGSFVTVTGAGAGQTILTLYSIGDSAQTNVEGSLEKYKIATALIGATTITLLDIADAADFFVGCWVCIMALDMQASGFPQNNHFFEYRQVTNIAGAVLTLDDGLHNDYLSTYPGTTEPPGFADTAGPATAFPMIDRDTNRLDLTDTVWPVAIPPWDQELTIRNLSVDNNGLSETWYGSCRKVLWEDCSFIGDIPFTPTFNQSWIARRCDASSSGEIEVDKLIEYMEFDDCQLATLTYQSSSVEQSWIHGCTINNLSGAAKHMLIEDSTINGTFRWGGLGYGTSETQDIDGCTFNGGVGFANRSWDLTGVTIVGGLVTIPGAKWYSEQFHSLFVPGTKCRINNSSNLGTYMCFSVGNITTDGVNFYVVTDIPDVRPRMAAGLGTTFSFHPGMDVTVTNSTGTQMTVLSRAPANHVLYSYYHSGTCNGVNAGGEESTLWGNIVSITVNVITPYTGAQTIQLRPFYKANLYSALINPAGVVTAYDPVININTAGTRVITPGSTTGTQTGDSGLDLTAGDWWIRGINPDNIAPDLTTSYDNAADISGESPSVWPSFTVEIITDQGI